MINYTDMARTVCWTVGSYLVLDGVGVFPHATWKMVLTIVGLVLVGLALIKR